MQNKYHHIFVKICCISTEEEASLAVSAGASALGLVSAMPSGPGVIADELIAAIAAAVPPPIATFLLTYRLHAKAIIELHQFCRTTAIQLVDHVPHEDLLILRKRLPDIKLVQVIHVTGPDAVKEAVGLSGLVDALLLDSGNPNLSVKELGGTGRTHDWRLSREICEAAGIPVFLAGGLNAGNVAEAIRQVNPFGVDVCSGVRTDGKLDPVKLKKFFAAIGRKLHE